ncbi:MAG: phenylalanine--tRNA ligase subunit beta [Patescibacteria group bacterium]
MLISFNWLKKYVKLPDSVSAEDVAEKLKQSTVEIEKVASRAKDLENIVVGKVVSCDKHPNADKLQVCKVSVGNEEVEVVCGGSNVKEGMLVALAKVGAKVRWHGAGELVELAPTEIRGVKSFGMICASTEIGLADMFPLKSEKEILDLSGVKAKPGAPLNKALGLDDAVLEIDNKSLSNRPDLWGHYGLAREVAALYKKDLKAYEVKKIKSGKGLKVKVEIEDKKLCPRYMAVAVSGIKVKESPEWLKKSLLAVGLRPINNIVDITNYVMMDLGQPMHAFDAKVLSGDKKQAAIVVRRAKDGEEFVTLDEQKRKLDSSMLMIANPEKSLAIAGVMGGMESGINAGTDTIIFESANFDASSIRKTSTKLGLRTDSSARFEKSLDPNLCVSALSKAVQLALELNPGAGVGGNIADEANFHLSTGPIGFGLEYLKKIAGVEISKKEAVSILERLGFAVTGKGDEMKVKIPSWRATKDISLPEDLVEEIVRIYGYENILSAMPTFPINPPEENKVRKLERQIRDLLVKEMSYTDMYNYSFVSPQMIAKMNDDVKKYIELDNPISQERPYVRRHLITNLLENILKNIDNHPTLRLFEIGKTFISEKPGQRTMANNDDLLPRQDTWLTSVFVEKKNAAPFWQARRVVENILGDLGQNFEVKVPKEIYPWQHKARVARVMVAGEDVGSVYELNPAAGANLGLEWSVGVAALNIDKLAMLPVSDKKYKPLSEYPAIERDLAILVKKEVSHGEIISALAHTDPILASVDLFDVYEGENIGAGYKSMAYHFVYRDLKRTLTAGEVEKVHSKILKILQEKFKASVR